MFTRFNGKVVPFADDSTSTNRTVFGGTTQSDLIDDNLNTNFKKGWEIVGLNDNPTREDFNAMGYTLGNLISYLYQQGISEYNASQEYYVNSLVMGSNGVVYQSLSGAEGSPNVGNDPITDDTNWKLQSGTGAYVIDTVDDFGTVPNGIDTVIVKDLNRGGTFIYDATESAINNGGTVFDGWVRQYSGTVNVKWFGASSDRLDNEVPFQLALDTFGKDSKGDVFFEGAYTISSSIKVRRGKSLQGNGSAEIIADFSSGNWNSDYVALKYIVDESPTAVGVMHNSSQHSYGFTLTGKNNSGVISYGMKFYTSFQIAVGIAVNYSFLFGKLSDISIRRFDTAMYMVEVNSSSFNNIIITECRRGIYVAGKSVNVVINNIYIANPTFSYTSSVETTKGFSTYSSTHYDNAVEGRPEGFSFNGGAIMEHANNLHLHACLSLNFENVMLDLATEDAVVIISVDLLTIRGSYIFTSGVGSACIRFNPINVGTNQNNIIESNYLIGVPGNSTIAIYFPIGGAARYNMTISKNKCKSTTGMSLIMCPNYSSICDNTFEYHEGNELINVQNDGLKTIIDGNSTSTSGKAPLRTHPAVTSSNLKIGANTSPEYDTNYTGYVTLLAGTTSIEVPTYLGAQTNYVSGVVTFTPPANIGTYYFTLLGNKTVGTLTVETAPVANTKIWYTVMAIPYTATI